MSEGQQRQRWGWNTFLGLVILLVVGVVAAWLLVLLARAGWTLMTTAPPQVTSAVVIASATALGSVLTLVYSKRLEHKRQIEEEQRKQKAEIYEEFMGFWFGALTGKGSEGVSQEEQAKYVSGFTFKLVTWASEPFLKDYVAFTDKRQEEDSTIDFEKILFDIRADLGYSNKGLNEGNLLKVFLDTPGVDKLLAQRRGLASNESR